MSATAAIAGAPGAEPTASPNGGAPAAQPAAPASPAPWYGDLPDPELKGWAENKGWKSPADALKSHREAERMLGVPSDRVLKLPDPKLAKPEEWNPVYSKLGWPDKPEDYEVEKVEGGEEFEKAMRPVLHSLKLTKDQVLGLSKSWNAFMKSEVESRTAAEQADQADKEKIDIDALHREWPGETYAAREEMARRGVREFVAPIVGGDRAKLADMLRTIEDAVGTATFLKLWANVGERLGEAKFNGDVNSHRDFRTTPAQAQQRKDELMSNREWVTRYNGGDKAAQNELAQLNHIITGA